MEERKRLCFKDRAGVSIPSCTYKDCIYNLENGIKKYQNLIHKIRLQKTIIAYITSNKILCKYHLLGSRAFES